MPTQAEKEQLRNTNRRTECYKTLNSSMIEPITDQAFHLLPRNEDGPHFNVFPIFKGWYVFQESRETRHLVNRQYPAGGLRQNPLGTVGVRQRKFLKTNDTRGRFFDQTQTAVANAHELLEMATLQNIGNVCDVLLFYGHYSEQTCTKTEKGTTLDLVRLEINNNLPSDQDFSPKGNLVRPW